MSEIAEKSGNKGLVITLVILCLMIVGLGVGIGYIFNQTIRPNDSDGIVLKNGETVSVAASNLYYEYVQQFENDPDFVSEDAIKGFNEKIEETNNDNYKIELAVWCANFINTYGEGPSGAADYLKTFESSVKNSSLFDDVLIEYYVSLRTFLSEAGDSSEADVYNEIIDTLLAKASYAEAEP